MEQFWLDQNFDYRFLRNKTERYCWTVVDTDAAAAAKYGVFFHALAPCVVEEFWESHRTACSSSGTVTLEKLSSGTAPDAGIVILNATLALNTTANTPQQGVLKSDISTRQLARGDRLCLKDAGTLTDTNHVTVVLQVRYKL